MCEHNDLDSNYQSSKNLTSKHLDEIVAIIKGIILFELHNGKSMSPVILLLSISNKEPVCILSRDFVASSGQLDS